MELNLFIPLVIYGRSFFQLSAEDSVKLAEKTLELSSSDDSIIDLIDLYDLIWRKNRDEETIEESTRVMPICYIMENLPEKFIVDGCKTKQSGAYKKLFKLQESNDTNDYQFFISEKDQRSNKKRIEAQHSVFEGDVQQAPIDPERFRRPQREEAHTHHHPH